MKTPEQRQSLIMLNKSFCMKKKIEILVTSVFFVFVCA